MKVLGSAYVMLAVLPALSSTSYAQTRDSTIPPIDSGMEEIVVTAQKRAEPLQDAPLAISAITAKTIEQRGIVDVSSLSAIAPNLTVNQQGASSATAVISIRGIVEGEPVLTVDSPNAIYVDGVIVARSTGAIFDMIDLERIEVLRGPQGTLYGRNTTGGAVNFITKRPADKFGVHQMFSYGRFDYVQSRTTIDTGEWGDSGIRAKFGYVHKERDGYVDNINNKDRDDPGGYNVDAFRVALSYDKGGPFRAFYGYDFNDRYSHGVPVQMLVATPDFQALLDASPLFGGDPAQVSLKRLKRLHLDDKRLKDRVQGHNLTLEMDLSKDVTLRSITGYRRWDNDNNGTDLDGTDGLLGFIVSPAILAPPFDFVPLGVGEFEPYGTTGTTERTQRQWSQEFNLIGKVGDKLDYVLGAYYFEEEATELIEGYLAVAIPLPIEIIPGFSTAVTSVINELDYYHKSQSKALFGQATYYLTDKLSVTGGVRYTWDKRHLDETRPQLTSPTAKFGKLTWTGNLKYEFTDDLTAYGSISRGYRSGGFNARGLGTGAQPLTPYRPEIVTAYEIGLKSEWFDRRLRVNLAGFYSKYKDLHVSQFESGTGGFSSVTVNAGGATYQGVEAEILAMPIRGLTLSANVGYTDRDYSEYLFRDPATNQIIDIADEARFANSANTTITAAIDYAFALGSIGTLTSRLDYNYRGTIYFSQLDRTAQFNQLTKSRPVSTFDGRITLSGLDIGGLNSSVAVFGKNITNRKYRVSVVDFGGLGWANGVYAEPATWGIDLSVRF